MLTLSGTLKPRDQFGQIVLELDELSKQKMMNIERCRHGKSPRFNGIVALKTLRPGLATECDSKVGQLVKLSARVRAYSFDGRTGWRLICEELGAYGAPGSEMRPHNAGIAYEHGDDFVLAGPADAVRAEGPDADPARARGSGEYGGLGGESAP